MSPWRFFRRHLGIFASIDAHCAAFAAEMRRNSDGRSLGRLSESRARRGCGHGRFGQRQRKVVDLERGEALADPDFYRQDAKAFAARTARLGVAQSELEAAETEWLELEILREELKS
jgi:hypothetical protein